MPKGTIPEDARQSSKTDPGFAPASRRRLSDSLTAITLIGISAISVYALKAQAARLHQPFNVATEQPRSVAILPEDAAALPASHTSPVNRESASVAFTHSQERK